MQIRITGAQAVSLLACLAFGKSIGITSGAVAREVHNDTWLAMTMAFVGAFVLVLPFVALARRFPDQRPAVYIRRLLGPFLGGLVLLLFSFFFLGSFIFSAITVEAHVNDYLMTETPLIVFVVGLSLLCLYGAYLGLEVIGRLALSGLAFNVIIGLLMVMGSLDHFRLTRMLPTWDHGLGAITVASAMPWTDSAMTLVGLIFLWPRSKAAPERWQNLSWLGVLLGAITVLVWPIFELGVLGPEVTAQYLIACMQLARAAELGIYLHRYEMIMMIFFGWGALVQAMALLYLGLESLREVFALGISRGWFMLMTTLLQIPIHYFIAVDRERFDMVLNHSWPVISLPVALGLPLLLWLVAMVRRQPSSSASAM